MEAALICLALWIYMGTGMYLSARHEDYSMFAVFGWPLTIFFYLGERHREKKDAK